MADLLFPQTENFVPLKIPHHINYSSLTKHDTINYCRKIPGIKLDISSVLFYDIHLDSI